MNSDSVKKVNNECFKFQRTDGALRVKSFVNWIGVIPNRLATLLRVRIWSAYGS